MNPVTSQVLYLVAWEILLELSISVWNQCCQDALFLMRITMHLQPDHKCSNFSKDGSPEQRTSYEALSCDFMLPSQEISPQSCWNRGLHPFFSLCIYLFSGFSSNYVLSVYIEPEYPVQFPSNQSQSTTTELTTKLPAKDFNVTWLHCLFLRPSTCHLIHDPMQSHTRNK